MTTRFATSSDSTRIAFDINGAGTPILLLHGGGGSRTDWHEQGYVARLAKEFTVIAIDLRGHGESDKPIDPDSYSTEKMGQDILTVADACGFEHFVLWGYSFGGNVGRYLAVRSDRISKMIMLGYSLRQAEIADREKERLLQELHATQNQLQELAVTEERTRLARELHDSLGHQLTVAVVQLEGAQRLIPTKPDQASQMIGAMREELKNALADLRRTVTVLRSPVADDLPLESALLTLTQSFQQNTGLATHFTAASNLPELPEPYRLALYRAVQEGLTNIQRHANAQNAWVNLDVDDKQITLTIKDNGAGLEQSSEKESSVGLIGLGERASQLGGEMRVFSPPEAGGTQLTFILPLPEKRKSK